MYQKLWEPQYNYGKTVYSLGKTWRQNRVYNTKCFFLILCNCRADFAGDFNIDVMNQSSVARNYLEVFHQYRFVNLINWSTYVLPNNENVTSFLDHVVSPALCGHHDACAIFKVKHDSTPTPLQFRAYSEAIEVIS